jgi:hypothetical protein
MLRFLMTTLSFVFLFSLLFEVRAHSWYETQCCSEKDCAPVTDTQEDGHGNLIVTSEMGTVFVPKTFIRRPSQDDKDHICMITYGGRSIPICYYVATGTE